jgi:aminoglycoside 6'-N-acetyltransferase
MPDSLPTLRAERLTLRPLEDRDLELLMAIVTSPGVGQWWGSADHDDLRNDGSAFTIEVDGEPAGWLGFDEENEPDYQQAGIDISLAPGHQGRGLGPEALRTVIEWLVRERGHHRFTIDPAAANERAIAAYAKVGFKPVGIMRRYERGPDGTWHDNLLMDLLAEEL